MGKQGGAQITSHSMELGHEGVATAVDVVKGSNEIASAGEDGRVNRYSIQQGKLVSAPLKSGQSITAMKLQNDIDKFFTASTSGNLRFWDTKQAQQKPVVNVKGEGSGAIHSLDIHPSRPTVVATGNEDGSITIWDIRNFSHQLCKYKHHQLSVWEVQFHPTVPDYILSGGDDGDLLLWDFHSPTSIQTQYAGKDLLPVHRLLHSPLSLNTFSVHKDHNVLIAGSDNEVLH